MESFPQGLYCFEANTQFTPRYQIEDLFLPAAESQYYQDTAPIGNDIDAVFMA